MKVEKKKKKSLVYIISKQLNSKKQLHCYILFIRNVGFNCFIQSHIPGLKLWKNPHRMHCVRTIRGPNPDWI